MVRMYKPSYYNHLFAYRGGILLFNAATGALLYLPENTYVQVQPMLSGTASHDVDCYDGTPLKALLGQLQRGRFLIDAETNELEYLRRRAQLHKEIAPLTLTVATTMDCNLACYYCFEDKYKSYMSKDICDLIAQYVAEQIEKQRLRRVYVDLFGGEPMLNSDCIEYLSAKLVPLCDGLNVKYHAMITSNGTCWPENPSDILNFAQKNRIHHAQFTFDGLSGNHNKRRRYANPREGASSFDVLSRTVSALVGEINIRLRLNCDRGNIKDLYRMVDFFVDCGWLYPGSKLFPYPARISAVTETCDFLQGHEVDDTEFNELYNDFQRYVAQFVDPIDYAAFLLPRPVKLLCGAVSPNSLMIGPDGSIYKCHAEIGAHNHTHGHIRDLTSGAHQPLLFRILSNSHEGKGSAHNYAAFDAFSQPTCSVCKYLPLCMSGCPKQQLEKYRFSQSNGTFDRYKQYWDQSLQALVTGYADLTLAARPDREGTTTFEEYLLDLQQPSA